MDISNRKTRLNQIDRLDWAKTLTCHTGMGRLARLTRQTRLNRAIRMRPPGLVSLVGLFSLVFLVARSVLPSLVRSAIRVKSVKR